MTEHFLHYTKVCSIFHEMRRKRMAEGVRRNLFADISQQSLSLDHLEH